MQQLQKIDIDWDIHRMIEAERRGFDEPPRIALRRLLKLPPIDVSEAKKTECSEDGVPWVEDGISVPHGSLAKMEYDHGRQIYEGRFLNGYLIVEGRSFKTLSAAASSLAITKKGKKTRLNGWEYWKVKFPGETNWRSLKQMRTQ